MRSLPLMLLLCALISGCAGKAQTAPHQDAPVAAIHTYDETSASALAFDPPLSDGLANPALSRADRGPSAFVGFDGPVTTFYYVRTDDNQRIDGYGRGRHGRGGWNGNDDYYERRAVTEKAGVSYR